MRIKAAIVGDLDKILQAETEDLAVGLRRGIQETADDLKQTLRDQVTGAGLGRRLANAWRADVYPKARGSKTLSPAALVYTRARKIVRAFDEGALIQSDSGFYLAVPTDAAPRRGTDGKRISPSNFPEARFGPLRFVYRRRGPSLLVVDSVRIGARGRVSKQLSNGGRTKTGRLKKGVSTVAMFLLVRQVRLPKRLNVAGARRRAKSALPRNIARNLARVSGND